MIRICDIPVLDRPVERLLNLGAHNLNNEELIAILLNTGTKNSSSKVLSSEILAQAGNVKNIGKMTLEDLISIKGIGKKKAASILAAVELGYRINKKDENILYKQIKNADDVYSYFADICENLDQEHFYCLYLDVKKRVIACKLLFVGTLNYSLVHPREVFKEAYLNHAISVICIHNHPSGDVTPSRADIELTKRLAEGGLILGISIDDHIIVGNNHYYSFFEDGNI